MAWLAASKPLGSYLIFSHPGEAGEDFEEAKHSNLEDSENKVGGRHSLQPVVQNFIGSGNRLWYWLLLRTTQFWGRALASPYSTPHEPLDWMEGQSKILMQDTKCPRRDGNK